MVCVCWKSVTTIPVQRWVGENQLLLGPWVTTFFVSVSNVKNEHLCFKAKKKSYWLISWIITFIYYSCVEVVNLHNVKLRMEFVRSCEVYMCLYFRLPSLMLHHWQKWRGWKGCCRPVRSQAEIWDKVGTEAMLFHYWTNAADGPHY